MKKIFTLLLVTIMAFGLISCGQDKPKEKTMDEKYEHAEGFVDEPPIHIEDVPVTLSAENNTVVATFTNNTDKKITSYEITALNKATNKKVYFQYKEKVNSKKTSPKFESSDSAITNAEDIEIQKYAIGFTDEKGLDRIVQYNCKTKKYILI